ncbi:MAG: hypothetical protein L6406_26130, partial [Desulfobacterales bacterium]|nr:hypothetical protein [Desulfobacterales bacterium]
MIKEVDISIPPDFIKNYDFIKKQASKKLKLNFNEINSIAILKRSIDSRKKPVFHLRIKAFVNEDPQTDKIKFNFQPVKSD